MCPEPGGVPFSSRTRYNGPYNVGSEVTYSCLHGGGGGTITCQSDGVWTKKPTCSGFLSIHKLHCSQLTKHLLSHTSLPSFHIFFCPDAKFMRVSCILTKHESLYFEPMSVASHLNMNTFNCLKLQVSLMIPDFAK